MCAVLILAWIITAVSISLLAIREHQTSKERGRLLDRIMELAAVQGVSDEAVAKRAEVEKSKQALQGHLAERKKLVFKTPEAHLMRRV